MQSAPWEAQAYQMAAEEGISMEDQWNTPELSLQPHAWHMHGGAGGAGLNRAYDEPQPEPQPAGSFRWAEDSEYSERYPVTTNASKWGYNIGQLNIDLQHQVVPSSVTSGSHNVQNSADSFAPPYNDNHISGFECCFPGCYATFFSQWKFNEHCKLHQSTPACQYGDFGGPGDAANGLGTSPEDPVNMTMQSHYGLSSPGVGASVSVTTQKSAFTLPPAQHLKGVPFNETGVIASNLAVSTSLDHEPPLAPSPNGRYACILCHKSCARPGDLRRHMLKHVPGPKTFECSKSDCPRKGPDGFARKDKMLAHEKVCQGPRGKYRA